MCSWISGIADSSQLLNIPIVPVNSTLPSVFMGPVLKKGTLVFCFQAINTSCDLLRYCLLTLNSVELLFLERYTEVWCDEALSASVSLLC